jgi:hypothetical protein
MTDVNAFVRRTLLVAAVSVLPLANIASAHGGGSGSSGSSASGSSSSSGSGSSSGGHSSSSSSSGHSSVSSSSGHSVSSANAGHSAPSKVSHPAADPSHPAADPNNGSQAAMTGKGMHVARVHRTFEEHGSSTGGYNQQNTETNTDEWRRRHPHLLFGFIRY